MGTQLLLQMLFIHMLFIIDSWVYQNIFIKIHSANGQNNPKIPLSQQISTSNVNWSFNQN